MRKSKLTRTRSAAILAATLFSLRISSSLCFADGAFTWDSSGDNPINPVDGGGNWSTTGAADWSNGMTDVKWPATGTNTAIFGDNGTPGTVTITAPVAANGLVFNSTPNGDYTIASSGSGSLTLNGSSPTIVINGGLPTISAPILGTGGLTVIGSGGVVLTATNHYTGGTTLYGGIAITSDAAINNGAGGVVFAGGLLQFNATSSNLSFADAGDALSLGVLPGVATNLTGNIGGTADLTFYGPGELILSGNSTYNGSTFIVGGTLALAANKTLPAGGGVTIYSGGTLAISSDAQVGNTTSQFSFGGGALQFNNYASNLSFNNVTGLGLGAADGVASKLNGNISGSTDLTYYGPGLLTLTGSNNYTGGTTLQMGTLAINSDAAINNGTGGITFDGGVLQLDNYTSSLSFADEGNFMYLGAASGAHSTLAGNISGNTTPIFTGPGTLVLAGQYTYSGNTYVSAGTVIVGSGTSLPAGSVTVLYGGTLGISSDNQITTAPGKLFFVNPGADIQFENYGSSLSFNDIPNLGLGAASGASSSLSGNVAGTAGLAYFGPGLLTLTGTNTYTGPTNVNAGTLVIGSASALPSATVLTIGASSTQATLQLAKNTGRGTLSSLAISSGSTLDITNNSLVINYGKGNASPLASIRGEIATGYHGGAWNGAGIISSLAAANNNYAVGYADGSTDIGTTAAPGQILIKYALIGDTNLDNTVNLTDLLTLLNSYGQTGRDWSQGDFNYDGTVNLTDLLALLNNYGLAGNGDAISTPVDVPEPLSGGAILLATGGALLSRRRFRNATQHQA